MQLLSIIGYHITTYMLQRCNVHVVSAVFTQDILLLKGEGEVKLNMVMGKGELALRSYGATGQEVVRSQLQEVEDAWATLLVTAMSCHRYEPSTHPKILKNIN